ncbi:MAG: hypothetical protein H7301_06110 [Cryobacterium sp.]|nr:hypothetical protein [Oligoflexia bacterium]
MRNLCTGTLAALSLSLCGISSAHAYIPPSSYQLSQLVKKHRGLKSLRVKTRITGTKTQIREIGYFNFGTKTWKARFLDASDKEIYAFERKLGANDSLASLLLFDANTTGLMNALKNAGIPVVSDSELAALPGPVERQAAEKGTIGRLDKKVGWITGNSTQALWVLKDEFVPLKLLNGGMEIRFEETKSVSAFPYPRSISLQRGSEFILKGEAMEVMANVDLSDMNAIQVHGLPAIPSSLSSEERALIEQWVQWIR